LRHPRGSDQEANRLECGLKLERAANGDHAAWVKRAEFKPSPDSDPSHLDQWLVDGNIRNRLSACLVR